MTGRPGSSARLLLAEIVNGHRGPPESRRETSVRAAQIARSGALMHERQNLARHGVSDRGVRPARGQIGSYGDELGESLDDLSAVRAKTSLMVGSTTCIQPDLRDRSSRTSR